MKNKLSIAVIVAAFMVSPFLSQVHAQAAVMPTLYNLSGIAANIGNTRLAPGNYYLVLGSGTVSRMVEYYGNGTYYDPSVGLYGGSISNPNGTAGVMLSYSATAGATYQAPTGTYSTAQMPILYNQNNVAANTGTGSLSTGFYALTPGGAQIYYFGNGTFYNPMTRLYGGSIMNPNGTAGVSLGYSM